MLALGNKSSDVSAILVAAFRQWVQHTTLQNEYHHYTAQLQAGLLS